MSVRMRHTSSHTKNRRSHHALKAESIVKDKESGALRLPHRLDETTGMYRGKQIITNDELKRRQARNEKRAKRAEAADHQHANIENIPAHAHQPEMIEKEEKKGVLGRLTKGGKAKARSGFGGGA
jgi:ribosomal protein L32